MIIGHRGAGRGTVHTPTGEVHENTIPSFLAAYEHGAAWVETDAVRTADNELVLYHDTVLTDGTPIDALTLAEAAAHGLDALAEVFRTLPASLGMIVEVKHILGDTDAERPDTAGMVAAALVAERRRCGRPLSSYGFDASTAGRLKPIVASKGILVGTLAEGGSDFAGMVLTAQREGLRIVAAHTSSLLGVHAERQMRPNNLASIVRRAHEMGQEVLAWCPGLEEARALSDAGVDALCVDDVPAFMTHWVR